MNTVSHFLKYQNIIFWLFWVLTESKLLSSICSLQAIKWYSSSHSLSPFNFFYLFFIKRFFCFFVKTLTENLHPFLKIFLSFSKDTASTKLDRTAISILSLRFFLSFKDFFCSLSLTESLISPLRFFFKTLSAQATKVWSKVYFFP